VLRGFPDINFRHLIAPLAPLGGGYVPIFDGIDVVEKLLEQGKQDARTIFGVDKNITQSGNSTNDTAEISSGEDGRPTVKSSLNEGGHQFLTFDLLKEIYEGQL